MSTRHLTSHVPPEGKPCLNSFWIGVGQISSIFIFCSPKRDNYCIFFCSAEMSAGQIQHEDVLHSCWMHLGGSQPVPANPRPVHAGRDEGVPLCCPASGMAHFMLFLKIAYICIFFILIQQQVDSKRTVFTPLVAGVQTTYLYCGGGGLQEYSGPPWAGWPVVGG